MFRQTAKEARRTGLRVNQPRDPLQSAAKTPAERTWLETADLSSSRTRGEFVDRHPQLVAPEVVLELTALVPQLAKSDRAKALEIAEVAVFIARRLDDSDCAARSLRAKANALYALGQNKAAIAHHRKALRRFRFLGNTEQVARTLSSSIQPLILQGRYAAAHAAAREARKIFTKQGNQWRVARLNLNVGNILDRQDRFFEALQYYKRAYKYLLENGKHDPEAVAVALHNMAVSYVSLNDSRKAEATYEKARSFAAAHGLSVLVGQADYNIAWLHYLRGDYSRAISMLQSARETCRSVGDDYHVALCQLDLSEIYLKLNLNTDAAEAAEEAAVRFGQLVMQYERGKSIANLAIAMSRQGNAARALELFLEARRIFVREKNRVLPSVADLHRATVLLDEGHDTEARRLSIAALRIFQKFQLTDKSVACRLLLARLALRANDVRSAQQQCTHGLKTLTRLKVPVLSCQAYALRGEIQAVAGCERLSYKAYRRAAEYLERLRSGIHSEELKISFMKDRVAIYEALVALCLRHANRARGIAEIFRYIQQAKSRTLLDILSTSGLGSSLSSHDESKDATRIRQLREELNWYFHMIEKAQLQQDSRRYLLELRTQSQKRERELLKLCREQLAARDVETGTGFVTTYTVDQIRESIAPDTTILEYFEAQGRVLVVVLSRDRLQVVPVGETSRVSTSLDLLQLQLSKLRLDAQYVATFANALLNGIRNHLQDLHQILVAPIRGRLSGRHLVVAPYGALHKLPFHALFDGRKYLIDEFTVSYAPSASIYAVCQARSERAGRGSLILGIPDPTVPFVKKEIEAVAASLPDSEVLVGGDASIDRLRRQGSRSRIIHIATHGYFRRDNPMFSSIRLGDSYLSLYDLYQLRLSADLVTLSGCSTGLNVVAAGDELLGLGRGLIHAGAMTSMLTLWDVQDQSTALLMTLFYGNLAGGRSKAVALQDAILQLKREYPHPYHWAPFILVGKV